MIGHGDLGVPRSSGRAWQVEGPWGALTAGEEPGRGDEDSGQEPAGNRRPPCWASSVFRWDPSGLAGRLAHVPAPILAAAAARSCAPWGSLLCPPSRTVIEHPRALSLKTWIFWRPLGNLLLQLSLLSEEDHTARRVLFLSLSSCEQSCAGMTPGLRKQLQGPEAVADSLCGV